MPSDDNSRELNLNLGLPGADIEKPTGPVGVRSLRELLDRASHRVIDTQAIGEDPGLAESNPYPFLALVGQADMKLALLLNLINPVVGGVLLVGPRGTAKTTAARSLLDILPNVERSLCQYGCLPKDVETGGMDAVCPSCAQKFGQGEPLARTESAQMVELPLNSRLEDVVGGIDERASLHHRLRLKRGILAQADQNILYVDEINLLPDEIMDAILDAAAMGKYTVRRGPMSATYRANFTLIGSMNPEEGNLRPQMLDRFGLRVIIRGLNDPQERLEAYQRAVSHRINPHKIIDQYAEDTELLRNEIAAARQILPTVTIPENVSKSGLELIKAIGIDSLRAEITMFEAARAYAAADNRTDVSLEDLLKVAPMALRLRQSNFIRQYIQDRLEEDKELAALMNDHLYPERKRAGQE